MATEEYLDSLTNLDHGDPGEESDADASPEQKRENLTFKNKVQEQVMRKLGLIKDGMTTDERNRAWFEWSTNRHSRRFLELFKIHSAHEKDSDALTALIVQEFQH